MDHAAGRILKKLETLNEADNTLVIFTSDNGSYRTDRSNNRNLKGRKTQLWEGGIRAPGIIKWPDKINPGTRTEIPWSQKVLSTCYQPHALQLSLLPKGVTLDGTSLLPLFSRGKTVSAKATILVLQSIAPSVCYPRR